MVRKHSAVLITYLLFAVVMSWPLVLNLSSAIPGVGGDAGSYVWALGWAKAALVDLHVNPFHTDYIFYPLGGATQLLWAVSLLGLVSIPLQPLGLAFAHNFLYLAATILTAYGTFLLADYVLGDTKRGRSLPPLDSSPLPPFATLLIAQFVAQSRLRKRRPLLAPFAAGLVFAFAPLRLGYGLAFLNLYNTELVPFYLLFLLRATREKSRRAAVIAGLFLGLNAYLDFQIAAFLILLTALYAVYRAFEVVAGEGSVTLTPSLARGKGPVRQERDSEGPFLPLRMTHTNIRALLAQAAFLAVTGLVSLLVAAPMLAVVANDFAIEGGNYIQVYKLDYSAARSYDLLSFFVPNARSSLYSSLPLKVVNVNAAAQPTDETPLSPDRQAFGGYVALALAVYASIRRWKMARFWALTAVLFALFSLGPFLHVAGQATNIPLPYLLLHEIPIINHIRIPMRYGIVVDLALALLVGIALQDLTSRIAIAHVPRLRLQLLVTFLPLLILAEYAVLPYPAEAFSVSRIYDEIARVPGAFTVLEIPSFNWRWASATEVYQAVHEKRILRAYTNRIAPGPAEYFAFRGIPIVVRSLRILEGAEKGELTPDEIAEDERVRDQVLGFYDLRYAVVHRDMLTPAQVSQIEAYVRDVLGGRMMDDDGETTAYALPQVSVPDEISIDLRENIGQMYAGRGWQFQYPPANWNGEFNFVWARGAQSEIYFPAVDTAERVLTLNAHAETPQRVSVLLNGEHVRDLEMTPDWKDYRIALPAQAMRSGMNRIELAYGSELTETIGVTTIQITRGQDGAQTQR